MRWQDAEDNGNDLLVSVDVRGVEQIKQKLPDAVSIWVLHSSSSQHELSIDSIADERLLHRLQEASRLFQIQNSDKFDHVLANDGLDEAIHEVIAIICSERSRLS